MSSVVIYAAYKYEPKCDVSAWAILHRYPETDTQKGNLLIWHGGSGTGQDFPGIAAAQSLRDLWTSFEDGGYGVFVLTSGFRVWDHKNLAAKKLPSSIKHMQMVNNICDTYLALHRGATHG